MSDQELPVSVNVRRPDGTVETIQVGTATKSGAGYLLKLELFIGSEPTGAGRAAATPSRAARDSSKAAAGSLPTVFPPYGRSKGMPIAGASRGDLDFYANGAKRSLSDPSKARFHDKEHAMLAAIEAELARQGGGEGQGDWGDDPPPPGDLDMPPPEEES